MNTLLQIRHLNTVFHSRMGDVHPVCDVNLTLQEGEVLGLIGESGCGKSVLGLSILNLLPNNADTDGEVLLSGDNLLTMSRKEMRQILGKRIAYIGQNPAEALNPVLKNGTQLRESVRLTTGRRGRHGQSDSEALLGKMGFIHPELIMRSYPIELSGGMKQRVLASMAMSGRPDILIADEPTKGLDALIRSQVIATFRSFLDETKCAAIIITHDLRFADALCDRIAVMYAGEMMEIGTKEQVLQKPHHPYVRALIDAQPERGLHPIKGNTCSLIDLPPGCRFCDRCGEAGDNCRRKHPEMIETELGHYVRCDVCLK